MGRNGASGWQSTLRRVGSARVGEDLVFDLRHGLPTRDGVAEMDPVDHLLLGATPSLAKVVGSRSWNACLLRGLEDEGGDVVVAGVAGADDVAEYHRPVLLAGDRDVDLGLANRT
jgi:hypothetical protein